MSRHQNTITKIATAWGNHFIVIEYDDFGKAVGGWIEHPRKAPDAQMTMLVDHLSQALHQTLSEGLE